LIPPQMAAHEVERRPRLTCSRRDSEPVRLQRVNDAYDAAAELLTDGRRLADSLVQLDYHDDGLVALWREKPSRVQVAAVNSGWNAATGHDPGSVSHLIWYSAAGDPS